MTMKDRYGNELGTQSARGRLDELHELAEGRPGVQVLRRLPVAAGGKGGARRDQPLDLGLQFRIEARGGGRLEVQLSMPA